MEKLILNAFNGNCYFTLLCKVCVAGKIFPIEDCTISMWELCSLLSIKCVLLVLLEWVNGGREKLKLGNFCLIEL